MSTYKGLPVASLTLRKTKMYLSFRVIGYAVVINYNVTP